MDSLITLALLLGCGYRQPAIKRPHLRQQYPVRSGGREARYCPSSGRWQIYEGDRVIGEVETRDEAVTRVTDPSAGYRMGPDRTIQT